MCRRCGKTTDLQCAHIVSRRYHAVRWDSGNAIALCRGCHKYFTDRPIEWRIWVIESFGEEYLEDLERRALEPHQPDYPKVLKSLEEIHEGYDEHARFI